MVTYKGFFAYYLNHLKSKLVILNKTNNHILCSLKHVKVRYMTTEPRQKGEKWKYTIVSVLYVKQYSTT